MEVEDALRELLSDLIGSWSGLIDLEIIIRLIEALLEVLFFTSYSRRCLDSSQCAEWDLNKTSNTFTGTFTGWFLMA